MNTNNKYNIAVFEENDNADLIEYSEKMKESIETALDNNKGEKGDRGEKGEQGIQGEQGVQGIQGPRGKDFSIYKTYSSIEAMNNDAENVEEGNFVIITSDIEDEDNAKLFVKTSEGFNYLTDMSGATGMKGEQGIQGVQGPQGIQGEKGEKGDNGEIIGLSNTYKNSNIVGQTCEGFGKIHKLFGKTEEVGSGEKSPSNPYEISCVADNVNLLDISKLSAGTKNGVTFTLDENIITLNGTCTADNTVFIIDQLDKFIRNINNRTTIFVEYLSGSVQNATDTTAAVLTTATWSPYVLAQLKNENSISISNITTNDTFSKFQIRIDNNVILNNYKIRIKASQSSKAIYSKYNESSIKISSTDETNTSNKIINCKPLCCLKDDEGNIVAQDYIDFDRQKVIRTCKYFVINGNESWYVDDGLTNCLRLTTSIANTGIALNSFGKCSHLKYNNNWSLDEPHFYTFNNNLYVFMPKTIASTAEGFKAWLQSNSITFVFRGNYAEEDIDTTNSIVQYANETTISNSENAEMEIELTNNKAISSINKNISELQEKNNEVAEGSIAKNIDTISFNAGLMSNYELSRVGKLTTLITTINYNADITNTAKKIATISEEFRPRKNIAFAIGLGNSLNNGWSIEASGYAAIYKNGEIWIRNTSGIACRYAFINISYISD